MVLGVGLVLKGRLLLKVVVHRHPPARLVIVQPRVVPLLLIVVVHALRRLARGAVAIW